jgi:hypothetical protein
MIVRITEKTPKADEFMILDRNTAAFVYTPYEQLSGENRP